MERRFICEILQEQKNVSLILTPTPIKSIPDGTKVLRSLIDPIMKEGDCSDVWIFLYATVQMGVLRFKVLILISPTVQ